LRCRFNIRIDNSNLSSLSNDFTAGFGCNTIWFKHSPANGHRAGHDPAHPFCGANGNLHRSHASSTRLPPHLRRWDLPQRLWIGRGAVAAPANPLMRHACVPRVLGIQSHRNKGLAIRTICAPDMAAAAAAAAAATAGHDVRAGTVHRPGVRHPLHRVPGLFRPGFRVCFPRLLSEAPFRGSFPSLLSESPF
jgi:hypothetical protein